MPPSKDHHTGDPGTDERLPRPRIGVSSCLLGESVRFDGGHKHNSYITQTLGQFFDFEPLCPEVAIGLDIPRPPIRLVGEPDDPRAVGVKDPTLDVTEALRDYGERMAGELGHISGYIFKRASPSCGMERVKVYDEDGGMPDNSGRGIYARAIMQALPLLPTEEEGRLNDPVLRENFVERVYVYRRWQDITAEGLSPRALVDFHTEHKYLVMTRGHNHYQSLGRLVAEAGRGDIQALGERYIRELMATLSRRATRKRHSNVLMHLMGYLKKHLDGADKQELLELIEAYRRGRVPLVVPLTMLRHHLRRFPNPYLLRQYYLRPHPEELMLRNEI